MRRSAKSLVRAETERMKWVVIWVAVFFGSVVVFVAMPKSALHWVANRLDFFGDGIARRKPPPSRRAIARQLGLSLYDVNRLAVQFPPRFVRRTRSSPRSK